MGLYTAPRRDYRFMTAAEKEHDRVFALAMSGLRDAGSDEMQIVCQSLVDDLHDLATILAEYERTGDSAHLGFQLAAMYRKEAESMANEEAEKACEGMGEGQ
jgi:hypothetical protein